ncbi:MAG: glycosyltransferase family 2 protein [Candidatus Scalindua sp.]|nr:glycosyltransferase family 2 protein [Candidatus Scalindua sp.]
MKFSAYMFIRNGIRAGYTFMEAIENVLPFVDEFFILEGQSDDGTREALELFAKWNPKIRIESKLPQYVKKEKDKMGLLLGTAFEEARQKCDGDWLIQVQADTVFHPITIHAAICFLTQGNNALKYDAITIMRYQYRWNWQEMYRKDYLNLIFKKSSGKVFGDAINITIEGKTSKKLLPLFEKFPVTDNAWIFFENITGKVEGFSEIWIDHQNDCINNEFPWYNTLTGRSLKDDIQVYNEKGIPPPFWKTKTSKFKNILPGNLWCLIGKLKYDIAPRFVDNKEIYDPTSNNQLAMITQIKSVISPISLIRNYFSFYISEMRRLGIRNIISSKVAYLLGNIRNMVAK